MTIWERLGIEPTTDIRKIKAAYAAAAGKWHPEEYPEEFQALQKAYKAAAAYAKRGARSAVMPQGKPEPAPAPRELPEKTGPAPAPENMKPERPDPALKELPEKIEPVPAPEAQSEASLKRADGRSAPPKTPAPVSVPKATKPENPVPAPEADFDYSEVDVYGQKEQFFRDFFLIAKNPCLMNNLYAWELFLYQRSSAELFTDTAFRIDFVKTLCGLWGFQRKTLLFLESFLESYHRKGEPAPDGGWETQLGCFRRKKRFRISLSALKKDDYGTREGVAFQDSVMAVFRKQKRRIDFKNRTDVVDYMRVYLPYARSHEDTVDWLYRQRRNADRMLMGIWGVFFVSTLIMLAAALIENGQDTPKSAQEREIRQKWMEEMIPPEGGDDMPAGENRLLLR